MEIPEVKVMVSGHGYALEGFEEFQRWAHANLPVWHHVRSLQRLYCLADIDALRLLCYSITQHNRELMDHAIEHAMHPKVILMPKIQLKAEPA